jgi:hypothetical protein
MVRERTLSFKFERLEANIGLLDLGGKLELHFIHHDFAPHSSIEHVYLFSLFFLFICCFLMIYCEWSLSMFLVAQKQVLKLCGHSSFHYTRDIQMYHI